MASIGPPLPDPPCLSLTGGPLATYKNTRGTSHRHTKKEIKTAPGIPGRTPHYLFPTLLCYNTAFLLSLSAIFIFGHIMEMLL